VKFRDLNEGLIVGDGCYARTGDGGSSWAPLNSGTNVDLYDFAAVPTSGRLIAVGAGGKVIAATDPAGQWQVISVRLLRRSARSPSAGLRDGLDSRGRRASYCDRPTVAIPGRRRQRSHHPPECRHGHQRDRLPGGGRWGILLRTTNGGQTWAQEVSGASSDLYGLCFLGEDSAYACGSNGTYLWVGPASPTISAAGTAVFSLLPPRERTT